MKKQANTLSKVVLVSFLLAGCGAEISGPGVIGGGGGDGKGDSQAGGAQGAAGSGGRVQGGTTTTTNCVCDVDRPETCGTTCITWTCTNGPTVVCTASQPDGGAHGPGGYGCPEFGTPGNDPACPGNDSPGHGDWTCTATPSTLTCDRGTDGSGGGAGNAGGGGDGNGNGSAGNGSAGSGNAGAGGDGNGNGAGGSGGNAGGGNGLGGAGSDGLAGMSGGTCGSQVFNPMQQPPPNMLLVMDKSGSMRQDTPSGLQKWAAMRMAVAHLVMMFNQVRFGLMLFPTGNDCGPGQISVAVGAGTASQITSIINQTDADGHTPTSASLQAALAYPGIHDPTRSDFVVLATDGVPNCGSGQDTATVTAVRNLAAAGIRVFVIGFGTGTAETDVSLLNSLADAGGTARNNAFRYYRADDLVDLDTAFRAIAGAATSCSYRLASAPPNPNRISVSIDGQSVPADAMNGWSYDPAGPYIQLHGTLCDRLQTSPVSSIEVTFGCP